MLARLGAFVSIFLATAVWEAAYPRRASTIPRRIRWRTNLALTALNTLLVWTTIGGAVYAAARFAAAREVGLLHWLGLPPGAAVVITLLGLDFAVYLQHVLFHAVPILWRVHRVHHADLAVDASTGLRFHPVEIFLSLGLKGAVVILLGAVPWAVIAFEVLLNASSVFTHGNIAIPDTLDRRLRWVVVTPDMHRVHHSARAAETNSNFGFSFSCWDRLCGTYRAVPREGQLGMELGLREYRTHLSLAHLLVLPFQGEAGPYSFAGTRAVAT